MKYIRNNKHDIVAKVRSDNLASIKIFAYSGFEIIQDNNKKIYLKKKIKSD